MILRRPRHFSSLGVHELVEHDRCNYRLGQGETHQAREERAICFGDKARRNRLDSIQIRPLSLEILLWIFSSSTSACFVRKPRREKRWPLFVKRHQGAGTRLSRGLHPRQEILKFRRISVVRGITTVFFAPFPSFLTTPSTPFPLLHAITDPNTRPFVAFSNLVHTRVSVEYERGRLCRMERNGTMERCPSEPRVDHEIHSPAIHSGYG